MKLWESISKWLKRSFERLGKAILRKGPEQKPLLRYNLYHHCCELPLYIFIECVCDQKYSGLVKYGKATELEILKAWELVYSEYIEKSGSVSSKYMIGLSKELGYLYAKLKAVPICLKVLQIYPDYNCINILKNTYHFNYEFDFSNPNQYSKDLQNVSQILGNTLMAYQIKKAEYDRESSKIKTKGPTRDWFLDILTALRKHLGSRVDPQNTTVGEFISYKKSYEKEIQELNRINEKETGLIKKGMNLSNINK
jgi:hypothetical protein